MSICLFNSMKGVISTLDGMKDITNVCLSFEMNMKFDGLMLMLAGVVYELRPGKNNIGLDQYTCI